MALRKRKSRTARLSRRSEISAEVQGLLIFTLGFFLFLAIWSYHPADPTMPETSAIDNEYTRTQNWLGIVGATGAKPVFEYTFGYASIVFPVLIMLAGIFSMMRRPMRGLLPVGGLLLLWAWFFGIVLAMRGTLQTGGWSVSYYPSGLIGGMTSDLMARLLGEFALGFLTGLFGLILLMTTFRFQISGFPQYVARVILRGVRTVVRISRNVAGRVVQAVRDGIGWVRRVQWLPERPAAGRARKRAADPDPREVRADEPDVADAEEPEGEPVHDMSDFVHLEGEPGPEIIQHHINGMEDELPPDEASLVYPQAPPDPELSGDTGNGDGTSTLYPALQPPPRLDDDDLPSGSQYELELDEPEGPLGMSAAEYEALIQEALSKYSNPGLDLLFEDETGAKISREELMQNADLLENTLSQFGVKAFVKKVIEGPVITMYAVRPAEGVKINQVVSLADDLALAMRAKGIRMIAPIPGEAAIGIEIPNRRPSTVYFKSIVKSEKYQQHKGQLVIGMGKTISGEVFCADLAKMPHLLIAGATGAGKSVGINSIISSIIYRVPPSDVKFVMIDPKKLELSLYAKLKDHYLAYCPEIDETVITHPQNAILVLRAVVNEMEERYDTLAKVGVRDIVSYNKRIEKFNESGTNHDEFRTLPYIVVIIDELADLILTASREVEEPITRLAQMARAVGIHLIVATQRPSVDILTGLIKANFPTRIAYQVATRPDSKVILDMYGAEKLIGNGDMLFLPPGTGKPVRLQNPYISTEDVEGIIEHIREQPIFPPYELTLTRSKPEPGGAAANKAYQDDLFEKAREVVVRHQQGSVSLLQRKLKVGYARAGRLMDSLEEAGVVGPNQGSKAREVLVSGFGGPPPDDDDD